MSINLGSLVRLEKGQIERASEVLSRAFRDDPELLEFFPESQKRQRLLLPMFRVALAHALRHGEVYTVSPAFEGVAVWLPSDAPEISLWTLLRGGGLGLLFKTRWEFLRNLRTFWGFWRKMKEDDEFARRLRRRLAPFPHWYLSILGVAPEFQGKGCASRLLKPMLARLDAANLPCYVETTIEEYVPIYQHFGFKVIQEEVLPGSDSKMWVMLRGKGGGWE
jgi:ribosomal protein S18 acetylase RimI-like enzyme